MNKKIKTFQKMILATAMMFSTLTITKASEPTGVEYGAVVTKDESSPTGYTVTFTLEEGTLKTDETKTVEKIDVTGPFSYGKGEDGLTAKANPYNPFEYENGMYAANIGGYTTEMVKNADGDYQASFPITSGAFAYKYVVTYTDGTTEKFQDPANPGKSSSFLSVTGDMTSSVVYGKWDAVKQSDSPNLDYVLPASNQGKVEYVTYNGYGDVTQRIGVYTPYGYDENRAEPYKTIYMSHGAGGNETDWFAIGQANNIMDNMIENGTTEPAVIVTMDMSYYNEVYPEINDNLMNYIIPFVEENYNVSTKAYDRAFCGLSMGGMIAGHVLFDMPGEFGYVGCFSGAYENEAVDVSAFDNVVMAAGAGNCDFASKVIDSNTTGPMYAYKYEHLITWAQDNNVNQCVDLGLVPGSHDWFTWAQLMKSFVEDVCWSMDIVEEHNPGVTVEGNNVTFCYEDDTDLEAVSVTVAGNLQWYDPSDVTQSESGVYTFDNAKSVDAYHYVEGMINTGYGVNDDGQVYTLTQTSNQHFEITMPLPGNLYYYDYTITYADGSTKTIKDPANMPVPNPANGHDAGHSLVYVGDKDNCTQGQEYVYAREDQNGTRTFLPYTAVDGSTQYLEVYLPYGYDATQTYPTIYVSHGGGGQEAEWMTIGAVGNIMDNLIAEGSVEPTVVVTMDNGYFSEGFTTNYDKIAQNFEDCIFPAVEAFASVSTDPQDRAMCGLSAGGSITANLLSLHNELFGYYGVWSPRDTVLTPFIEDGTVTEEMLSTFDHAKYMIGVGIMDIELRQSQELLLQDTLTKQECDTTMVHVRGAHDWAVWRELFTIFAKDFVWEPVVLPGLDVADGVTVSENTDFDNTDAAFQATFAYTNKEAVKVELTGGFTFYKPEEVESYKQTGTIDGPAYSPYEYKDGMFVCGQLMNFEMTQREDGQFTVTLPLPGNQYYYAYNVTLSDGTVITNMPDPANPSPENKASGKNATWSTFYVGDKEHTASGQEYIYPNTEGKNGKLVYDSYKAVDGSTQHIGVYLPYGYSENREYKLLILCHGLGGNEVEWMTLGSAGNILDNLTAAGEVEPTVVVSIDATHLTQGVNWYWDQMADNMENYLLPYLYKTYSLEDAPEARAVAGLSAGGMFTNSMAAYLAKDFRYYGSFSGGTKIYDEELFDAKEINKALGYLLICGNIDQGYNCVMPPELPQISTIALMEFYDKIGVNYDFQFVNGAHDWQTWRNSLTIFAKDYLWEGQEEKPVTPEKTEVNTGDNTPIALIGATMLVSAAAFITLKKKKETE